ncbi:MAG TPA: hypothetical protein ENG35_00940 [Desulfobacteraceae bacterium]|nr:hypothetical protein [Desulfobacteraceae bacterium]
MPGFDGTGPAGAGPMTGGARGLCNPAAGGYVPVFARGYGYGRGFGRGAGFGRGYGWYPPAYAPRYPLRPEDEINGLKAESDYLKGSLDAINKRIEELEKEISK